MTFHCTLEVYFITCFQKYEWKLSRFTEIPCWNVFTYFNTCNLFPKSMNNPDWGINQKVNRACDCLHVWHQLSSESRGRSLDIFKQQKWKKLSSGLTTLTRFQVKLPKLNTQCLPVSKVWVRLVVLESDRTVQRVCRRSAKSWAQRWALNAARRGH